MLDGSRGISTDDLKLYASVCHKPILIIVNKIDLCATRTAVAAALNAEAPVVHISASTQQGIDELKEAIFTRIASGAEQWEEHGCAPNIRQKHALSKAYADMVSGFQVDKLTNSAEILRSLRSWGHEIVGSYANGREKLIISRRHPCFAGNNKRRPPSVRLSRIR